MATILGTTLRNRRKTLGMTQNSVATALNVSRAAIGQWEAGTHEPSTENLIAVCNLLDLNIDAVVRGEYATKFAQDVKTSLDELRVEGREIDLKEINKSILDLMDEVTKEFTNKIDHFISRPSPDTRYFLMYQKAILKYPRPDKLIGNEYVYCTSVCDNHLFPKFANGDVIYLNPQIVPKVGDYILIKSKHLDEPEVEPSQTLGDTDACVLGLYCSDDAKTVTIQRFSPPELLRILMAKGVRIERVYDPAELITFEKGK